eukprot:8264158-Pyramimonas_sp.AAC.1
MAEESSAPWPPAVGDAVVVTKLGLEGKVVNVSGNQFEVRCPARTSGPQCKRCGCCVYFCHLIGRSCRYIPSPLIWAVECTLAVIGTGGPIIK